MMVGGDHWEFLIDSGSGLAGTNLHLVWMLEDSWVGVGLLTFGFVIILPDVTSTIVNGLLVLM